MFKKFNPIFILSLVFILFYGCQKDGNTRIKAGTYIGVTHYKSHHLEHDSMGNVSSILLDTTYLDTFWVKNIGFEHVEFSHKEYSNYDKTYYSRTFFLKRNSEHEYTSNPPPGNASSSFSFVGRPSNTLIFKKTYGDIGGTDLNVSFTGECQ